MILDWKPAEEIVFAVAEDGARCESSSVTVAGKTVKLPDVWMLQGLHILWPCMLLNTKKDKFAGF